MNFKSFWQEFNKGRDALTKDELAQVNRLITNLEEQKKPSSFIISALQSHFPKLKEKYRAETAYWTESKKKETGIIAENAANIGLKKFRIVNTPSACDDCKKAGEYGKKIFSSKDIEKDGKPIVPVHPNCYCVIISVD